MLQLDAHDKEVLGRVASDWRLTPATLGYKLSKGSWIPSPHLLYVSKVVAHGVAKGNARIIISAPPRHGKSQLIDVYTPIWALERFPRHDVILASYGADLSESFGREVRDTIRDNAHLLNVRIRQDASRVDEFLTETNGSMRSRGLGGSITGRGGHILLLDDYIKEIKEALSPTYRDYAWNWFTSTFYTRREPNCSIIIIATRWHSDDLIGRILKNFPGQWQNIVLRAEAEKDDILGRPIGQPLFPERYSTEALQDIKLVLGSAFWQALYQQRPIDEANKLTDAGWLKPVAQVDRSLLRMARVWDLAATEEGGDYTAGSLCGWDRNAQFFVILDVARKQLSPKDVEKLVRQTAVTDGVDVDIYIEQEPGSAGKALVEHYATYVLPEFRCEPVPTAGKNKILRAQPMLAGAEAGIIHYLTAQWNREFLTEFEDFPAGTHDDQVDTVSAAYTKLTGKRVFSATWGHKTSIPNIKGLSNHTLMKMASKKIRGEGQKSAIISQRRATWGIN